MPSAPRTTQIADAPHNRRPKPNFRDAKNFDARLIGSAIVAIVQSRGDAWVTDSDLIERGFTPQQIAAHGDEARAIARAQMGGAS